MNWADFAYANAGMMPGGLGEEDQMIPGGPIGPPPGMSGGPSGPGGPGGDYPPPVSEQDELGPMYPSEPGMGMDPSGPTSSGSPTDPRRPGHPRFQRAMRGLDDSAQAGAIRRPAYLPMVNHIPPVMRAMRSGMVGNVNPYAQAGVPGGPTGMGGLMGAAMRGRY